MIIRGYLMDARQTLTISAAFSTIIFPFMIAQTRNHDLYFLIIVEFILYIFGLLLWGYRCSDNIYSRRGLTIFLGILFISISSSMIMLEGLILFQKGLISLSFALFISIFSWQVFSEIARRWPLID